MRILVLADRLSERGGADQHLLAVLRALVADGHRVELVVGAIDAAVSAPCACSLLPALAARTATALPADALPWEAADVIHLHNIVNASLLEAAAAWPSVATVQDHRFFCPGRGKWTAAGEPCSQPFDASTCAPCFEDVSYFKRLLDTTQRRRDALARLPGVIVLSAYMRNELLAAGLRGESVVVVPPFVDEPALRAPSTCVTEPCVLFVGRLVHAKGVDDALAAWRSAGLELPLVFVGTGSQRAALEQAGQRVEGWLGRAELGAWYRAACVLVLPSRWQEPFGIVGLEALTLGLPVAAWQSGGVAEWHPGGAGLARWGDVEGLALALRSLVGGRAVAPTGFEEAAVMKRLYAVYQRVAAREAAGQAVLAQERA